MPIARITGQGLAAIAASVALLWSCVLIERSQHHAAITERARVVREVQRMQHRQRTQPASAPSPFTRHHSHVTAG